MTDNIAGVHLPYFLLKETKDLGITKKIII